MAKAVSAGVDPEVARRVVAAQIDAAKSIQEALFAEWRAARAGLLDNAPILTETLRPEITGLTDELIDAVKAAEADLGDCAARSVAEPTPDRLASFPGAWTVAIDGVVGAARSCP